MMEAKDKFQAIKTFIWLMSCDHAIDQWSKDCGFCDRCKAQQYIKELHTEYDQMKDEIVEGCKVNKMKGKLIWKLYGKRNNI